MLAAFGFSVQEWSSSSSLGDGNALTDGGFVPSAE
jgi:hypothetical protein